MRKKWLTIIVLAALACVFAVAGLAGCADGDADTGKPYLEEDGGTYTVGLRNDQRWRFSESEGFLGADVYIDGQWEQVLSGGGLFLDSPVVDSTVTSVSPAEGEETALRIAGDGWEAVYSFEEGSSFLKREFTWQIPQGTDELQLGALSPYLNTTEEKYDRERGFIGTYSEDDAGMSSSVYVTSGLPAIYSNVFNNAEDSVAVSMVLDREQSSAVFQLACRFFNDSRASARLGFYSASSDTVLGTPYRYVDYVELSDGETTDYYDQLGMIRAQLTRVSPIDYDALAASDNKTVQDYDTLAVGLVNELLDDRATNESLLYSFVPYAYSTGWGESFTSLMILRGLVKYADYTGDAALMEKTEQLALAFTQTVNGRNWIEDLNGYGDFLHYSYAGSFSDGDNPEMASNAIGTFKYFDRVNALGEIALYTGNEQISDAFLRLVPLVRDHLVGDDYFQPVCYSLTNLQPLAGTENGGSAGGAAIWGHINYLAYALTDNSDPLHDTYLSDAVGSLRRAANLGFEQMWAIVDAPKPTSVGWTVRGLLSCYKETGEEELLTLAEKVMQGLYHFYYYGNDPYITFGSGGMGLACSSEHWEAFMEFGQGLWLASGILEYSADKEVLDLYASAYYAGLWFFPVNLGGISTHSNANFYEWAESQYVPYEFGGGRLNDPALSAGDQSIYRMTKEIYGAGELFNLHMLFEAYGKPTNRLVLAFSPTAVAQRASDTAQSFRLYNASSSAQTTALLLRGFAEGTYTITKDGQSFMTVTSAQMRNGITLELAAGETVWLEVTRSSSSAAETAADGTVLLEQTAGSHNAAAFAASGVNGAAMYLLEVSSSSAFGADTKTYYAADGAFSLSFADGKTVWVRAAALTADGRATAYSQTLSYAADGVSMLADDDFSSADGWRESNTDFRSNGTLGIMNILAGDIGYGASAIEKDFTVTLSEGVLFEFIPYGKVPGSVWSLTLTVGGTSKTLVSGETTVAPGYVFDLAETFPGVTGEQTVTVRLDVEGYNRSFMIERVRFIRTVANAESHSYENLLEGTFGGTLDYELSGGSLLLSNDSGTETYFRTFTTRAIDLSGAAPSSYFRITLDGVRILDRVQVQIWDVGQTTKYYESTLNVSTGLIMEFDANGSGRLAAYPGGAQQYTVVLTPVSGAEEATVVSAFAGTKSDYSDAVNILAPTVSSQYVSMQITTDLTQNGRFVFDADMTAGDNAEWKVYVRDVETGMMTELRIAAEIEDFASAADYVDGVNNAYYFREKAGLFSYDVRAIMGAALGEEAIAGERTYEIVIEVVSGSMQVNQFYLTNANAQAAVCA